jgi:hypothetical protein
MLRFNHKQCCICGACLCATYVARFPLLTFFTSALIPRRRQYAFDPLCYKSSPLTHLEGARNGTVIFITVPYTIACGGCKKFWKRIGVLVPYSEPAADVVFSIITVLMKMRSDSAWRGALCRCREICHVDEFCVNISGYVIRPIVIYGCETWVLTVLYRDCQCLNGKY